MLVILRRGIRLRRVAVGRSGVRRRTAQGPQGKKSGSGLGAGRRRARLRRGARRRRRRRARRGPRIRMAGGPSTGVGSGGKAGEVRLRREHSRRVLWWTEKDAGLRLNLGGSVKRDRVVRERGLRHSGTRSPPDGGGAAVSRGRPPRTGIFPEAVKVSVCFFLF